MVPLKVYVADGALCVKVLDAVVLVLRLRLRWIPKEIVRSRSTSRCAGDYEGGWAELRVALRDAFKDLLAGAVFRVGGLEGIGWVLPLSWTVKDAGRSRSGYRLNEGYGGGWAEGYVDRHGVSQELDG